MERNFLKSQLYQVCMDFVLQRAATVEEILASNRLALESEIKSSAGDKHETGRAMLQLEMEKASQQLLSVEQMKDILRKIDIEDRSNSAIQGSLVITTSGKYFLAIGLGTVNIGSEQFYVVSLSSPIGAILKGKKEGESVLFNGTRIQIEQIC